MTSEKCLFQNLHIPKRTADKKRACSAGSFRYGFSLKNLFSLFEAFKIFDQRFLLVARKGLVARHHGGGIELLRIVQLGKNPFSFQTGTDPAQFRPDPSPHAVYHMAARTSQIAENLFSSFFRYLSLRIRKGNNRRNDKEGKNHKDKCHTVNKGLADRSITHALLLQNIDVVISQIIDYKIEDSRGM